MEKKAVKKTTKNVTSAPKAAVSPFDSLAAPIEPIEPMTSPVRKTRTKTAGSAAKKTAPVKAKAAKTAAPTKTVKKKAKPETPAVVEPLIEPAVKAKPEPELSQAFKTLAEPTLPQLERENRARLMMQTPTELYFYWSVKDNPYQLLKKAFGDDTGSYSLVVKLTNLNTGEEELHPADAEGSWWFHVEPNGKYEAEIGFYAPNRPYFRIVYSNTIETPRRSPSPHRATEATWTVSANKFAQVLDVAGFTSDAVDVAMAGDDHVVATAATHTAFSHFTGLKNGNGLSGIASEDIRYALRALASGAALADLRYTIGAKLFSVLQTRSADLSAEKAVGALAEYFEIDESEYMEETAGPAVYGASLVNFPRTMRPRRPGSRFSPVSSHSYPSSIVR
jgi:hypothetical protein